MLGIFKKKFKSRQIHTTPLQRDMAAGTLSCDTTWPLKWQDDNILTSASVVTSSVSEITSSVFVMTSSDMLWEPWRWYTLNPGARSLSLGKSWIWKSSSSVVMLINISDDRLRRCRIPEKTPLFPRWKTFGIITSYSEIDKIRDRLTSRSKTSHNSTHKNKLILQKQQQQCTMSDKPVLHKAVTSVKQPSVVFFKKIFCYSNCSFYQ